LQIDLELIVESIELKLMRVEAHRNAAAGLSPAVPRLFNRCSPFAVALADE
jgi:hypothetical protein